MTKTFDLLLRGGTLVTHNGIDLGDVGVRDGRIVAIGDLRTASAGEMVDATGLHVLPGIIDTQVHFRNRATSTRRIWRPAPAGPCWAVSRPYSKCPIQRP